jgi:hypothetical protein
VFGWHKRNTSATNYFGLKMEMAKASETMADIQLQHCAVLIPLACQHKYHHYWFYVPQAAVWVRIWENSHSFRFCMYYIHTYMHAYIHTYMHAYIHTYIHTYTHTHTLRGDTKILRGLNWKQIFCICTMGLILITVKNNIREYYKTRVNGFIVMCN